MRITNDQIIYARLKAYDEHVKAGKTKEEAFDLAKKINRHSVKKTRENESSETQRKNATR